MNCFICGEQDEDLLTATEDQKIICSQCQQE